MSIKGYPLSQLLTIFAFFLFILIDAPVLINLYGLNKSYNYFELT